MVLNGRCPPVIAETAEVGQRPVRQLGRLVQRAGDAVQLHLDEQHQGLAPLVAGAHEHLVGPGQHATGVGRVGAADALHREQCL